MFLLPIITEYFEHDLHFDFPNLKANYLFFLHQMVVLFEHTVFAIIFIIFDKNEYQKQIFWYKLN